jgi:thiosulfate/3-mercaptopyruvate sulfurtransferase
MLTISMQYFRQKDAYSKSHIPTAVHMDIEIATYPAKTERFATHPPKLFEEYVRLLGINSGDQLVLYDRGPMGGMLFASKIWWLFKVRVLASINCVVQIVFASIRWR